MENVVGYLFVMDLRQFLRRICILILVRFHLVLGKFLYFVAFQLLFFLLIIQVVCFYLEYQVVRDFFFFSKLYFSLGTSLNLVGIYNIYDLGLISG